MNQHLHSACESVDASVFSGDVLYDDNSRNKLKEYMGRWQRAIAEHERTEATEAEQAASGNGAFSEAVKAFPMDTHPDETRSAPLTVAGAYFSKALNCKPTES